MSLIVCRICGEPTMNSETCLRRACINEWKWKQKDAEIARLREQVAALKAQNIKLGGASTMCKCATCDKGVRPKWAVAGMCAECAEAKLAALEAQCAGMREACEAAHAKIVIGGAGGWKETQRMLCNALDGDSGTRLLARLRELEEVYRAAREWRARDVEFGEILKERDKYDQLRCHYADADAQADAEGQYERLRGLEVRKSEECDVAGDVLVAAIAKVAQQQDAAKGETK